MVWIGVKFDDEKDAPRTNLSLDRPFDKIIKHCYY